MHPHCVVAGTRSAAQLLAVGGDANYHDTRHAEANQAPKNRDFAEIHVFGASIIMVATRDVLSFDLVTTDSFPAESTRVFVFGRHSANCARGVGPSVKLNSC